MTDIIIKTENTHHHQRTNKLQRDVHKYSLYRINYIQALTYLYTGINSVYSNTSHHCNWYYLHTHHQFLQLLVRLGQSSRNVSQITSRLLTGALVKERGGGKHTHIFPPWCQFSWEFVDSLKANRPCCCRFMQDTSAQGFDFLVFHFLCLRSEGFFYD